MIDKIIWIGCVAIVCLGSAIATQKLIPAIGLEVEAKPQETDILEKPDLFESDPAETVREYAREITVKVFSAQNSGSGILIHRQGNSYQLITNDHVLLYGRQDESYKVQTPDGEIYPAKVVKDLNFQKYDLGVLQFESESVYEVASLAELPVPAKGEAVYAAGFPYDPSVSFAENFTFTVGRVDLISDRSFQGGYQIGYTNDIKKGMSGGPLLNDRAEIVGINGRHKYPVWGNPYVFEDGTVASPAKKEEMSQYSWAIPIDTFLKLAARFTSDRNFN